MFNSFTPARMFVIGLVLTLAAWMVVGAQSPDSLSLSAPETVTPDQPFVVEIVGNLKSAAYGFGFQLLYDPTQLEPVQRPDADGVQSVATLGALFQGAQRIRNTVTPVDNLAQIDAVYTLLPPAAATTGEGVLASVEFHVLREGTVSLELLNPRLIALSNGQASDIAVTMDVPSLALATAPLQVVQNTAPVEPQAAAPVEVAQNVAPAPAVVQDPAATVAPEVAAQQAALLEVSQAPAPVSNSGLPAWAVAAGSAFFTGVMFMAGAIMGSLLRRQPRPVRTAVPQLSDPNPAVLRQMRQLDLRPGGQLRRADLQRLFLNGMDLRLANLKNANLQHANLVEADLRGANLSGANLEYAVMVLTRFDESTVMPDGQHWTPHTDTGRYTDPNHPEFWRAHTPAQTARPHKAHARA